jgi:hypothetical protein
MWLTMAFVGGSLAVGLSYWPIPYTQARLPSSWEFSSLRTRLSPFCAARSTRDPVPRVERSLGSWSTDGADAVLREGHYQSRSSGSAVSIG